MKLSKLLTTIPTLAVVSTAPLVLCQCNDDKKTTITFNCINCSTNKDSWTIDTKAKWSEVKSHITSYPGYGFTNKSEWRIGSKTGELVNDNEAVGETTTVYILHNEVYQTTDGGSKSIDEHTTGQSFSTGDTYTASENINESSTSTYKLKYIAYSNHYKYTFSITLGTNIPKIKYFYMFYNNGAMYPFHTNGNNILSVTDGNGNPIPYFLKLWHAANDYIEFNNLITSGTINITIAFHETSGYINLIPIYESDSNQ